VSLSVGQIGVGQGVAVPAVEDEASYLYKDSSEWMLEFHPDKEILNLA
jgi:hypothetical protein